jgi:hypothetical protein
VVRALPGIDGISAQEFRTNFDTALAKVGS